MSAAAAPTRSTAAAVRTRSRPAKSDRLEGLREGESWDERARSRRRLPLPLAALRVRSPAAARARRLPLHAAAQPDRYDDLYLPRARSRNDLGGNEFKYAATPDPGNALTNINPDRARRRPRRPRRRRRPGVDTAWQTTTGRPDVTIAVLDSGIKWNDAGAMDDLRFKTRLNTGELPTPAQRRARDPDRARRRLLRRLRRQRPATTTPTATASSTSSTTPATTGSSIDSAEAASARPAARAPGRPDRVHRRRRRRRQRLRRRHRRLGLPRRRQRPLRRRPVRARHGRGAATRPPRRTTAGGARHLPELHGRSTCASATASSPTSTASAGAVLYATDNGVAGRPGGARHAQQLEPRAPGRRLRLPPRRHRDRLGRRRGRPAQQLALDLPHVILVNSVTSTTTPLPTPVPQSYLAFNGCTNFNAKITRLDPVGRAAPPTRSGCAAGLSRG